MLFLFFLSSYFACLASSVVTGFSPSLLAEDGFLICYDSNLVAGAKETRGPFGVRDLESGHCGGWRGLEVDAVFE